MALPYDMQRDPYHCPDHFVLERTHPGTLAAWTFGLLLVLAGLGALGNHLRTFAGSHGAHGTAPNTAQGH